MIEATFKTDSFNQNIQFKDEEAACNQIYNLLLMVPGTDTLNPDKGCDLNGWYYKLNDKSALSSLKHLISTQINDYTQFPTSQVMCQPIKSKNGKLYLAVMIQLSPFNDVFIVSTNGTKSSIQSFEKK